MILRGYNSIDHAYEVKDYPYGWKLKTSIFYWIETKKELGDRLCTYTINPKTGEKNKPKYGTYSTFLYLYLDENGYVKHGGIDAYDREYFQGRFGFIVNKIGLTFVTGIQQENIRRNYFLHTKLNAPYEHVKYSEKNKPVFKQYVIDTLKHILTCPFENLVDHPEPPEQDNPNGEVKMTVTEYIPKSAQEEA